MRTAAVPASWQLEGEVWGAPWVTVIGTKQVFLRGC